MAILKIQQALALILLFLLFFFFICAVTAISRDEDDDNTKYPDLSDSEQRENLRCNVCREVAKTMRAELIDAGKRRGPPRYHPTEVDVATIFDRFCEYAASEFTMVPADFFDDELDEDEKMKRLEDRTGNEKWIQSFFENTCSELLENREEDLISGFDDFDAYTAKICAGCGL